MDTDGSLLARFPELSEFPWFIEVLRHGTLPDESQIRFFSSPFRCVQVTARHRKVQCSKGPAPHNYLLGFWDAGVKLGRLELACSCDSHNATLAFLQGASLVELMQTFPAFVPAEHAVAHELGAAAEVRLKWKQVCAMAERQEDLLSPLVPLLKLLSQSPPFSQLYPISSMYRLSFSRTTGYPYSQDFPGVVRGGGGFRVSIMTSEGMKEQTAYTPEAAMKLMLQWLPPDHGPAVQGTARDILRKPSKGS